MSTTILGLDPGTSSFAFSVVKCKGKKARLVKRGWIPPTKKVGHRKQINATVGAVLKLCRKYKPKLVMCERFMFRGRGSVYTEVVSFVLGALMLAMDRSKFPIRFITAAQWKQHAKKNWGYDTKVKGKGATLRMASRIFPGIEVIHQLDAACMARYAWEKDMVNQPLYTEAKVVKKRRSKK